jgi:hypothetical protein
MKPMAPTTIATTESASEIFKSLLLLITQCVIVGEAVPAKQHHADDTVKDAGRIRGRRGEEDTGTGPQHTKE